jgi:hypothetical protein
VKEVSHEAPRVIRCHLHVTSNEDRPGEARAGQGSPGGRGKGRVWEGLLTGTDFFGGMNMFSRSTVVKPLNCTLSKDKVYSR